MKDFPRDFLDALEAAVMEREGERRGQEIRFCCPSHENGEGHTPSADYNRSKATWICRTCGAGGGALDLAGRLRVPSPSSSTAPRRTRKSRRAKVAKKRKPASAESRIVSTTEYRIRDTEGRHVATHLRHALDDGNKLMPWFLPGGAKGLGGRKVEDLPLYGVESLKGWNGAVVVTEGEKARDALAKVGVVAVGTVTGADEKGKAPSKEALAPLALPNVAPVLWPDNDAAGRVHMNVIAERLFALGKESHVLIWKEAPPKGDAADFIEQGRTREDVEELVLAALASRAGRAAGDEKRDSSSAPPPEPPAGDDEEEHEDRHRSDGDNGKGTQADRLVALVRESGAELWHTPDGEVYATIRQDGHDEHLPIRGRGFRQWLAHAAAKATRKAPSRNAIDDALAALGGEAVYAGKERQVHVRLAAHEDKVMLDLGDRDRRVVEVGADGWKVMVDDRLPVRFRRPAGALPLSVPERGGSIDLLRDLLNVEEADFDLIAAWLLGALNPRGPYAALAVTGEHGTGKSTLCNLLVALVDPKDVPLRRPPKDERDLFVAASNGHVVAFNNISRLTPDLSDALSAIATEGGFACRKLYENDEEARFRGRRPLLLNGIEDFVTRGDLGDRCIRVVLKTVKKRRTDDGIVVAFEQARPLVLGAMLDGVACALRRRHEVGIEELPRLADFALWIEAAAPGIGRGPGTLLRRYRDAVEGAASSRIEDDVIASALVRFMDGRGDWTGTAGDLLERLGKAEGLLDANGAATKKPKPKDWPETPRKLSGELTRLAPDLRAVGIEVERPGRATARSRARLWTVRARKEGEQPSEPSTPSESGSGGGPDAGRCADGVDGSALDRPKDRPHESADGERSPAGSDGTDGSAPPLREADEEEELRV